MEYYLLLGLHVGAVGVWIGGMLLSSLAIYIETISAKKDKPPAERLGLVLAWNRWMTTPAMLLVWGLGIAMTLQIGWYMFIWFKLKIAVVLLLSALYGRQAATLRRISRSSTAFTSSALLRFSAPVTLVATIVIVVLVVAKPFGV